MDLQILQWINNTLHGSEFINQLAKYITYLGELGAFWIVLGIALLCFKKTRKAGFIMLGSLAFGIIINNGILKNVIDRARPFTQDSALAEFIKSIGLSLPTSSSFPSGHTFAGFNCAIVLTYFFKWKGALAYIPATLIAFSRIFLCVHYPSDVLAAAIIGTCIGIICAVVGNIILNKLIDWYSKKRENKKAVEANGNNQN